MGSNLALPFLRKRQSQPQQDVEIDWSNPITRGMSLCVGEDGKDLVNKSRSISETGTLSTKVTTKGLARGSAATGSFLCATRDFVAQTDTAFSVIGTIQLNSTAQTNKYLAFARDNGGTGNQVAVIFGYAAGQLEFYGNFTGSDPRTGSQIAIADTGVHTFGYSYDGTTWMGFLDGVKVFTTTRTFSFSLGTLPLVGSLLSANGTSTVDGSILQWVTYKKGVGEAALKSLTANPWQIFKPRTSRLFAPLGAGSNLNASASGGAQSTGTASLAAQVALAAIGVSVAGGSATPSVSIPLSAAGIAIAGGSANATATITLSAAGLAQAAGQAGLSASVLLAGAGAAQAAGNATLAAQLNALAAGAAQATGTANLTGGSPGELSATGQAQAEGSAALTIGINLAAAGSAQSTGIAHLSGGAQGSLAANGQAQATGTAYPTIRINLATTGTAHASGTATGTLSAGNQITAIGAAGASGSAALTITVALTASGFIQAMGAGGLSIEAPITATGLAHASGSANIVTVPDYIPVAPLSLVAGIGRPTRLSAATQHPVILRHEVTRVYQH